MAGRKGERGIQSFPWETLKKKVRGKQWVRPLLVPELGRKKSRYVGNAEIIRGREGHKERGSDKRNHKLGRDRVGSF